MENTVYKICKNEYLSPKSLAKSLDALSFASASGAVGITSIALVDALREGQIALVGERSVHELRRVALILVRVGELGFSHVNHAVIYY